MMNYAKAITAAVELAARAAEGVKYMVDHPDDVKKALDKLTVILVAAKKLVDTAGDLVPIDALIHRAQAEGVAGDEALGGEGELAIPPKPAIAVPPVLKAAVDKAVGFRDEKMADLERARLEQEMVKAVRNARRQVLENASMRIPLSKLAEKLSSEDEATVIANMGILDASGCFAIARYGKLGSGKDYAGYSGIYVGKGLCVGDAIAEAIAPTGNADVYADIKYKQNLVVFVFSCMQDKLDEKYDALVELLGAGESYNRYSVGGEAEAEG